MKASRWYVLLAAAALVLTTLPASAAPADQANLDRASTLKIALSTQIQDPTNLNLYAPGVDRSIGLHQIVYEYLFYNNLETGEFIPWLAESYQYSPDYTSLSVKLRDGVTWNDGQPFTADDVVFTYDLLKNNTGMVWAEETNNNVASVEKIDNLNVRFNLKMANPHFHLIREAFPAVGIWGGITILPKHVWQGQDPLTFKASPPVGTGPYKLQDASQTAMTYVRRDDWWGTKVFGVQPAPKYVQFIYEGTETNAALALTNNDLDTPNIGILGLGTFLQVAGKNQNVKAWTTNAPYAWLDPCPRALMVQNAHPPFDNSQVRWALSYSIDRQAIANLAYEGATVPTWGIWPFYDANKPYFDAVSDVRQQYPSDQYDPDQAANLFRQAGVNPSDITLKYVVNSDANEDVKVAQVLSDQLRNAGFTVNVTPLNGGTLTDTLRRGDYDIAMNAFCPGYIAENLELFHSKNYVPLGQPAPWFERNSFRYTNSELDAVVDKMLQTPPDQVDTMKSLYHDGLAIWLRDLPVVPLTQAPALVPFNSTYWTGWPNSDNSWNMPVSWWGTFNLLLTGYPQANGGWVPGIRAAQH
ncbi:MAG: ABC transporter substrate-binding protein [Chloroflexi bacterium]|nr:ABC transporter substrate-binding protein [Chloroflexota bacterium]